MLNEIQNNLQTQDNRITAEPVFVVEQKRRDWGFDSAYCDDYAWVNVRDGDFDTVHLDTDDKESYYYRTMTARAASN